MPVFPSPHHRRSRAPNRGRALWVGLAVAVAALLIAAVAVAASILGSGADAGERAAAVDGERTRVLGLQGAPAAYGEPRAVDGPSERAAGPMGAASEAAERRVASRVHGRCIDLATGDPIPGVDVFLKTYGEDALQRTTGAKGEFEFPSTGYRVTWIEVPRPADWIHAKPRTRLTPEQRTGRAEVLLELAQSSECMGRVVDAATGEPVPALEVRVLEEDGYTDEVLTDLNGSFRSVGMVRKHDLSLRVLERGRGLMLHRGEEARSKLRWDPERDGPVQVGVGIGPTYRVRCTAGEPLRQDRLRVTLVERAPGKAREQDWVRIRDEASPWVRFPQPVERWEGSRFWLRARAFGSDLVGEAPVSSVVGRHPGVVSIELEPTAKVAGRVVDASGAAIRGALVHANTVEDRLERRTVVAGSGGRFEIDQLKVGRQELVVRAGALAPIERVLELPRGRTDIGDIAVGAGGAGTISGTLAFDSTLGRLGCLVELRSSDGAVHQLVDPDVKSPGLRIGGGPTIASFAFELLPPGKYEVRVLPLDAHRWEPEVRRVVSPAGNVVFARVPASETYSVELRARDALTDKRIPAFRVRSSVEGLWYPESRPHAWGDELGPFGVLSSVAWTVSADGYRPRHGDQHSFGAEGSRRVLDIALEPGWGARLHLREAAAFYATFGDDTWTYQGAARSQPAVAGALVRADGVPVGRSDATGRIDLALAREPSRITVEAPGLRVIESDFFRAGRLAAGQREVLVWLRRD